MQRYTDHGRAPQQIRLSVDLGIAMAFVAAAFLFGGSQRMDAGSQMLVRLAALAVIAAACVRMTSARWATVRRPTLLALVFAAVPALQLVPLPPTLWEVMPGHSLYADALRTFTPGGVWRPISLSPDRTLNSLLACLPPIAGALTFPLVSRGQRGMLIGALLTFAAIGTVLFAMQAATGSGYLYSLPQVSPSATFANRNHWAMFLACCFPLLVAWACAAESRARRTRWLVGGIAAIAILPLLLITGSRAGLALGVAALVVSAAIARPVVRRADLLRSGLRRPALAVAVLVAMATCIAFVLLGRGAALSRILSSGDQVDLRSANLPAVWTMLVAFFPVGAGFGVFDPVFRAFEADVLLRPSFFNHAHNDLLEIVIEAGAAGVTMILVVGFATVRTTVAFWRGRSGSAALAEAWAALVPLIVLMLGSLTDYPLRTPFLATFFVLCAVWVEARCAQCHRDNGATVPLAPQPTPARGTAGLSRVPKGDRVR